MGDTKTIVYVVLDPENNPVSVYHNLREAEIFIKSRTGEWNIYEVESIKKENPPAVDQNLAFK